MGGCQWPHYTHPWDVLQAPVLCWLPGNTHGTLSAKRKCWRHCPLHAVLAAVTAGTWPGSVQWHFALQSWSSYLLDCFLDYRSPESKKGQHVSGTSLSEDMLLHNAHVLPHWRGRRLIPTGFSGEKRAAWSQENVWWLTSDTWNHGNILGLFQMTASFVLVWVCEACN